MLKELKEFVPVNSGLHSIWAVAILYGASHKKEGQIFMIGQTREIVIVGGGIVGTLACLQLLERGWKVTMFDRVEPGTPAQTSWGNAGSISVGNVIPLGKPGFMTDGLVKLVSPNSPLLLPMTYLHRSLPWIFKVGSYANRMVAEQISKDIGALNMLSGDTWQNLRDDYGLQPFLAENGWLKLYESERSFKRTAGERRLMQELGIPFQVLSRSDIKDHEPEFSPIFAKAILQLSSLGINSPGSLMKRLQEIVRERGAEVIIKDIQSIGKAESGFVLQTACRPYSVRKLLLSSGAWSAKLAKMIGHNFPLETERGYHLFYDAGVPLKGPSINIDRYVAMSPMESGVRVTSCVELGGLSRGPDYGRIRRLSKFAVKALPKLQGMEGREWMGYRPSLPDSKPVIGKSTIHDGLFFAFGNGHLGMTQAAGTGKLIAQAINGEPASIPLDPFSPARF